jgi:hypothetical protein
MECVSIQRAECRRIWLSRRWSRRWVTPGAWSPRRTWRCVGRPPGRLLGHLRGVEWLPTEPAWTTAVLGAETGSCGPGGSGRSTVARRGVVGGPWWSRRCGLTPFGAERSGQSRPTGGPLLGSLCARDDGPLTVSLCVPAELAGPPESVVGAVPRTGLTFGYMNWCVIWSFEGGLKTPDRSLLDRTGLSSAGRECPRIGRLCLNSRRRKPWVAAAAPRATEQSWKAARRIRLDQPHVWRAAVPVNRLRLLARGRALPARPPPTPSGRDARARTRRPP